MIINKSENICRITNETIEVSQILTHEEDGTRLIFHAGMSNEARVIFAKVTDMFLVLIDTSASIKSR